ncbi:hypothetical protein LTS00_018103, partial [Friedmanniomyces endolithicus]
MPADHNSDGTVRVHVLFYGKIIWREDDCVAGRQRRTLASVNSKLWSLDVNYYIKAKKDAFRKGLAVPTMAEIGMRHVHHVE